MYDFRQFRHQLFATTLLVGLTLLLAPDALAGKSKQERPSVPINVETEEPVAPGTKINEGKATVGRHESQPVGSMPTLKDPIVVARQGPNFVVMAVIDDDAANWPDKQKPNRDAYTVEMTGTGLPANPVGTFVGTLPGSPAHEVYRFELPPVGEIRFEFVFVMRGGPMVYAWAHEDLPGFFRQGGNQGYCWVFPSEGQACALRKFILHPKPPAVGSNTAP